MKIQKSGVSGKRSLFKAGLLLVTLCLLALGLGVPQANAQTKVIFDSDMSSDWDDIGDIAVLNSLADLGAIEILACMNSSQNGATALCMNAINTWYGRPNVPCGRRPDTGGQGGYAAQIASEYPHPLYATVTDPPLCVNLYRQVLAAQPDNSVVIVTTGYLNNLQALLQSGPDQYSPLSGSALVAQKVKYWACAGGDFPNGGEFNFTVEPAAAQYVVNNWPAGIVYVGFDIGGAIYSGWNLNTTPANNPIRRVYVDIEDAYPHPTWGQIAVYYAARESESQGLFDHVTVGRNNANANGTNFWTATPDPTGLQDQKYLLEIQRHPLQEAIDTMVQQSGYPASGPASKPGQPTNIRATTIDGNRIDLQWTDNAYNETGFTIERKINGVFTQIATVGANVTSYSNTGLSTTANVAYRVKATNAQGSSAYTTKTVFSGGWTETNLSNPSDHTRIYYYYQHDNLNWDRPGLANHVTVNNDSTHGQDLTINVKVGGQGSYGPFFIYFFYQDQSNWYRLSAGMAGEGQQVKFEKCVGGTITQIGAPAAGVNIGPGTGMQNWQVRVVPSGTLQFFHNGNPNDVARPLPNLNQILSVSGGALSFSSGRIALGSTNGAPVWGSFSFDTTAGGGGSAPAITSSLTATGTTGTAFNYQITASGSPTSYNATGLPSGLSVNTGTGVISGTPSTAGTSNVALSATNGSGTGTATLVLAVSASPSGGALTGTVIGTSGSYGGSSSTADKVFDGNLATYFDAPAASGAWAGLDLGTARVITQLAYAPRPGWGSRMDGGVFQGSNSADFSGAVTLFTVAGAPAEGAMTTQSVSNSTAFRYVRYLSAPNGWGNIAEVAFYGSGGGGGSTPAITSSLAAAGTVGTAFSYQIAASNSPASYNATGLPSGLSVNTGTGVISGTPGAAGTSNVALSATNGSGTGTATLVLTVSGSPSGGALTGTVIGTSGSYGGSSWTIDKVFDGNLATFFDAPAASGAWAGLDLGTAKVITQLAYAPRPGWGSRMDGGGFQGSNSADFSGAVTLFTVAGAPAEGAMTTQSVSNGTAFRYVRYLSAPNGWGNIAEVAFYGSGGGGGGAPSAPSGLGATAGNAQVSLSWTASSGATSYNVYRGTNAGGENSTPVATGISGTSYTNTGLANGTTYYYKVAAVNGSGTSGYSNEASATPTTGGGGAPAAPTGLSATAGNAQANLSWTAGSGAASYNVYRGTTAGGESATPVATGITATTYTNTGLANGTAYYYKVAAVNGSGTSGYSNEASATPSAGGGGGSVTFANASFETPSIGGYTYSPVGSGWTFANNAGIQHNGSAYGGSNAPGGTQTALVQSFGGTLGTMSQSVSFPAGTHKIVFQAARRWGTIQPIRVSVNGTAVGTYTPAADSFAQITTDEFTITTTGSYTVTFAATDSAGDKTSLIDLVSVTTVGGGGGGGGGGSGDIDLTGYTLTFSDEFDNLSVTTNSPKGASKWYYLPPYGSAGYYSASTWDINALSVSNGILSNKAYIGAQPGTWGTYWYSGNISSVDTTGVGFSQLYGYFEARIKMPDSGTGAWPAFWLSSTNGIPGVSPTPTNVEEIDIFEWYGVCNTPGSYQAVMQQASHNWNPDGSQNQTTAAHLYSPGTPMPGGAYPWQGYHIYGCKIDPVHITWYIDGVQTNQIATPAAYLTSPFYIMIDYGLGGGWPLDGMVNHSEMLVDWVRVYSLPGQ